MQDHEALVELRDPTGSIQAVVNKQMLDDGLQGSPTFVV
jgi:hypothetical protein